MESASSQTFAASWDAGGNPVAYQDLWGQLGAFTTMRLDVKGDGRCPYLFERHMDRLFKTFDELGWSCLIKRPWLESCVKDFIQTVNESGEYLLRVMLSDVMVSLKATPWVEPQNMMSGLLWDYDRPTPQYKTLDYQDVLDALSDVDRLSEELLLVSEDGRLLEGATSCLMFVDKERIVIPERDRLDSVTLNLLTERMQNANIVVDDVFTDQVKDFDEILLCGSGKGVINLGQIPELEWQCRNIAVYRQLRLMYDNYMIRYKYNWM